MTEPGARASEEERAAQSERLRKVWENPHGWRYWTSVNNTQVGLWYASTAFIFLLFAGALALIMRAQLAMPDNDLVSADFYNQLFTLHGTVMMFLFAVPIFEAVAIFLLPPMIGARELPFPRLGAFGFWSFFSVASLCAARFSLMQRLPPVGLCIRRWQPTKNFPALAPTSGY